jgi:diguanylate cyclase (GGDEF)-like protein/PAS domain S-box-containing protein
MATLGSTGLTLPAPSATTHLQGLFFGTRPVTFPRLNRRWEQLSGSGGGSDDIEEPTYREVNSPFRLPITLHNIAKQYEARYANWQVKTEYYDRRRGGGGFGVTMKGKQPKRVPHHLSDERQPRALRDRNDAPSVIPAEPPELEQAKQEIQRLHRYLRNRLSEIEQVYQFAPVGLVLMDRDCRFLRINERLADINGLPIEAHIGRTLREVVPDLADHLTELYRPVYERGEPVLNVEIQGKTHKEPDVERYWLANFFPFRSETGEVIGLIGAVVDITERKRQETSLREAEERFRTIFEAVTDAIFLYDTELEKFVDVNQRAVDAFGYSRVELLAMSFADLSENKPNNTGAGALARLELAMTGKPQTFEWRCKKKDGTLFWVEIGCRAARFGRRNLLLSTLRDISLRKDAEEKLLKIALFDVLTGLANRGVFVTQLERAIAEARRGGSSLAVLYLDLDHFKDVNDTLGHPIGDRLLQSVAQRLRDTVRSSDTVARFGGDEFAVLMSDLHEPADAGILAETLVDVMELPFQVDENNIHIGTSIGIAMYEPEVDAEAMLSHADVALYRSKSEGRHTYRFFDDAMDLEVRSRVNLVVELRQAIAKEQLFVLYQPQVDLESGRITGVEALVRWRHPTKGDLLPGLFIPASERSGLIVPLGKWVLTEVCRQARRWLDEGVAPDCVAVNFSALQFKVPRDMEKDIDAVLAETGLPAHMLEVELTETTMMEATRGRSSILENLRKRGVRIAIDDFGTGYSSLAYLRRLPVDRIKLAQEFIVDLVTDSNVAAIVQAAIGLAHILGIDLIAEGVETERQLELLKSWGCGSAQGFYFAEPMAVEDVTRLLRQGKIDVASRSRLGEPDSVCT